MTTSSGDTQSLSEVDQLIASGASVRQIARHFRSRVAAVEYLAAYYRAQASALSDENCCVCGASDAPKLIAFTWTAILSAGIAFGGLEVALLLLGHIGLKVKNVVIKYETVHGICPRCIRTLRRRKMFAFFLNFVGFGSLLIGLFVTPIGFLMPVLVRLKPGESLPFVLMGVVGLLMIAAYPFSMRLTRNLQIPGSLRTLRHPPFQYGASQLVLS